MPLLRSFPSLLPRISSQPFLLYSYCVNVIKWIQHCFCSVWAMQPNTHDIICFSSNIHLLFIYHDFTNIILILIYYLKTILILISIPTWKIMPPSLTFSSFLFQNSNLFCWSLLWQGSILISWLACCSPIFLLYLFIILYALLSLSMV